MLEATYVAKNGNSYLRGVGISDDFMVRGLRRLTTAVHAHDGKIGVQLQHGGRTAQPKTSGHPIMLVSHVPGVTPYEESRVMDEEDIASVVTAYAQAAARAVESGFDLVELHAAHGYLLAQFLSPFTNRREDGYGGSFEKRLRFPLEVLQAVRTAVGPDYPVTIRLSVDEFMPGGMDLATASEIARILVARGVDALHVSVGLGETNHYTIPPSSITEGWNAERAATIRKAVNGAVPVMVAGRIVTRAVAEDILASGSADMVAMGRALIADPYLPNKFAAGMDADVLPCVSCNEGCVNALSRGEFVRCAVNPLAGCEEQYPLVHAFTSRRVVVIGGGPAGMQAALTAAQRGHSVTLLEKSSRLGGLLHTASLPPHKERYSDLARYFERALHNAGVDVHTGAEAGVAEVASLQPDVVLVATGGKPAVPAFCCNAGALTAEDALNNPPSGKKVLILGGGLVGCETAELLAGRGCEVTIVELRGELAADMENRTRRLLLPRLQELGVQNLLRTEVRSVEAHRGYRA